MGLIWAGYSLGLYGYLLIRGRDLTPKMLFSPTFTGTWSEIAPNTMVVPDGSNALGNGPKLFKGTGGTTVQ